jgi:hypothetical protein
VHYHASCSCQILLGTGIQLATAMLPATSTCRAEHSRSLRGASSRPLSIAGQISVSSWFSLSAAVRVLPISGTVTLVGSTVCTDQCCTQTNYDCNVTAALLLSHGAAFIAESVQNAICSTVCCSLRIRRSLEVWLIDVVGNVRCCTDCAYGQRHYCLSSLPALDELRGLEAAYI